MAWRTLGLAYERGGNTQEAINAYEQYIRLAPHGPQSDMVRELLASGADANARDVNGWTALMAAAASGSEEIAYDLLEDKADIDLVSDDGWSPLLVAADRGHTRLMRLLLEAGATVDAPMSTTVYVSANDNPNEP